jgi:hypothetical protein
MSSPEVLARESYEELLRLLRWFAKSGPTPTLIGGWAVWMYNSYLGSVDIDIVGPSLGGSFDHVIETYEIVHRYERVRRGLFGLEYVYRKPIYRGSAVVGYVEIDACSFEADPGRFLEDRDKVLPYKLCAEPDLVQEMTLDGDAVCNIPTKGLLFLYKLKAERDRSYLLRTRGAVMRDARRNWLEAKLSKDRADLVALLDPEPVKYVTKGKIDGAVIKRIIDDHELDFVYESLAALPTRDDALKRYRLYKQVRSRDIKAWLDALRIEDL